MVLNYLSTNPLGSTWAMMYPVVPFWGCLFLLIIIPNSPVPSFFNLNILNRLLVKLGKLLALLSEFNEGGPEDSSSPFFLYLLVLVGVVAVVVAVVVIVVVAFSVTFCWRLLLTGSGSLLFRGGFFTKGSFFSFLT